ncbi:MAG: hypothetical protein OXD29_11735 [Roseovarius sp.]|nr:hypothetical protein [Roseovarius sp.]MCY4290781.1 hypothetical protein [Roseovarius sp.]MCY4315723.1 hypothetical protein [Roseovarius sp.]
MKHLVICMKWGDFFGPEYVNLLFRASRHYLDIPFDFVCMTENQSGLDSGITVKPLPDLGLGPDYWKAGGWPKISVFKPGLVPDDTRVLFMDIDTVITGNMDDMFKTGPGVAMVNEWPRLADYLNPFRPQKQLSGVFSFDGGNETEIYEKFIANPAAARDKYRIEQYFIAGNASRLNTFPDGWVLSFKRHLFPPHLGVRDGASVPEPPQNARILLFHGNPRPVELAQEGLWGKRFRYGRGAVPFIRDYWLKFGIEPPLP